MQINDHKNEADKSYFNFVRANDSKKEDAHKNIQKNQELTEKLEESQMENEKLKIKLADLQIQETKNINLAKNIEGEKLLLETNMSRMREKLFNTEKLLEIEKNIHIKTKMNLGNEHKTVEEK